ncbi:MAG: hypothetical protein V1893_02190 [Candidatus Omnitrophota bacterium]
MADETIDVNKRIEEFILALSVMRNTRLIYGREHHITKRILGDLYSMLTRLLKLRSEITIAFIENEIVFDKLPLYTLSTTMDKFIKDLTEAGIEKIRFTVGTSKAEFEGFLDVIVLKRGEIFEKGGYKNALASYGVKNIDISKIAISGEADEDIITSAKKIYDKSFVIMKEFVSIMKRDRTIMLEGPRQVVMDILKLILKNRDILLLFANIRERDQGMIVHSINVLILTIIQSIFLGIDKAIYAELGEAALLHEIGKIAQQVGMLEEIETKQMQDLQRRLYANAVAKILVKTKGIGKLTPVVAYENILYHPLHATGMPQDRKMKFASMIIAIACYYDTLALQAYHSQIEYGDIYTTLMRYAGDVFEPYVLDKLFKAIGVYPPGCAVQLDSGELAVVVRANPDIQRPMVELLTDKLGNRLSQPRVVDISDMDEQKKNYNYKIVKVLSGQKIGMYFMPDKYR